MASTVEGKRKDIDDYLYRVNPDNARLAVFYEAGSYALKLEQVLTAEQDEISATNTLDPANGNNSFSATDGYALTNVYLNWSYDANFMVSLGAENLFDEDYVDHLSGFNRVIGSVVPRGSRMFGQGRNFFGRLQYRW